MVAVRPDLLLAFVVIAAGCVPAERRWAVRNGGTVTGAMQSRVAAVAATLSATGRGQRVTVSVLASAAVGAYAWPGGRVYVTRGLVERADDAMLAAAVGHELGHLNARRHRTGPATAGAADRGRADIEEIDADRRGAVLLASRGYDPGAMGRLLRMLHDQLGTPRAVQVSLRSRMAALAGTGEGPWRPPNPPQAIHGRGAAGGRNVMCRRASSES